jgi:hypothetical protein
MDNSETQATMDAIHRTKTNKIRSHKTERRQNKTRSHKTERRQN